MQIKILVFNTVMGGLDNVHAWQQDDDEKELMCAMARGGVAREGSTRWASHSDRSAEGARACDD